MKPTFLIAEIAQAHEGSLGLALSYCDEVKRVGFDAIKFQMHIAIEESTYDEQFRIKFSLQDSNRFEYWQRTSFSFDQWMIIAEKCRSLDLSLGISPFSIKALNRCRQIGVDFIKIGSGEVFNPELIEELNVADNVIISSGLSTISDSQLLVKYLMPRVKTLQLMHCHTAYPMPISKANLSTISLLRNCMDIPIGYSDHSGNINIAMSSLTYGISCLEVHAVFSKKMFGPDTSSSLDIDELERLVDFRDIYISSHGSPAIVESRLNDPSIIEMRNKFGRSIALKESYPIGHIIRKEDLCFKKPSSGFKVDDIDKIVGKKLISNYSHYYLLTSAHIGDI